MKKRFSFVALLALIMTVLAFLAVGCVSPDDEPNGALTPLPVPTGLTIVDGIAEWDDVAGAAGYTLFADTREYGCELSRFDLSTIMELVEGENYQIKVMALGDMITHTDSPQSAGISYVHITVPVKTVSKNVVKAEPDNGTMVASYTDGRYNYFYLYMGEVANVPVAYGSVITYNGVTPATVSYTKTSTSTSGVSNSMTTSISQTTSVRTTETNVQSIKNTLGLEAEIAGFKISNQLETTWSQTTEKEIIKQRTISTTSTESSFTSWSTSLSETISYTIGEHGESPGYYRYTLFATCDTFATVICDTLHNEYYYDFETYAKKNSYISMIDFNETSDFSGRTTTEKFLFDSAILTTLKVENTTLPAGTRILDYSKASNTTIGKVEIALADKRIIIIGNASKTYTMNILIKSRGSDLHIILSNMRFTGAAGSDSSSANAHPGTAKKEDGAHGIYDESQTINNPHTLYLELIGSCSVQGGAGVRGSDGYGSAGDYGDEGKDGGHGGDGIKLIPTGAEENGANSLVVVGKLNLTIKGGQAAVGGNGKKYSHGGRGGNGGNGGSGIWCKSVSFARLEGNAIISGGNGDAGGNGGFSDTIWGWGYYGGAGGNGGRGGYPIGAHSAPVAPAVHTLTLNGGTGSNGGAGGGSSADQEGALDGAPGSNGETPPNNKWWDMVAKVYA